MIRYALCCKAGHQFEAWFRSSSDYDRQSVDKLVTCPVCSTVDVEKTLMAPNVVSERRADPVEAPGQAMIEAAKPVAADLIPPELREMVEKVRELKAKLTENSENVGKGFAEEARKIHYGEAPARAVHGEATPDDARALVEEGIEILALPTLPDEFN